MTYARRQSRRLSLGLLSVAVLGASSLVVTSPAIAQADTSVETWILSQVDAGAIRGRASSDPARIKSQRSRVRMNDGLSNQGPTLALHLHTREEFLDIKTKIQTKFGAATKEQRGRLVWNLPTSDQTLTLKAFDSTRASKGKQTNRYGILKLVAGQDSRRKRKRQGQRRARDIE